MPFAWAVISNLPQCKPKAIAPNTMDPWVILGFIVPLPNFSNVNHL